MQRAGDPRAAAAAGASANSRRVAIRPGISCSASRISLRPNSASPRSATLKSVPWRRSCSSFLHGRGHRAVRPWRSGGGQQRSCFSCSKRSQSSGADVLGPARLGLEPALDGVAQVGARRAIRAAKATSESPTSKRASSSLSVRSRWSSGGSVEPVARRRAGRRDQPGPLDVAQHPRRPARRLRRLVDRQSIHRLANLTTTVSRFGRGPERNLRQGSSPLGHLSKYELQAGVALSMVTNLDRKPEAGHGAVPYRTPIVSAAREPASIGLVVTLGCAVFGVGGAAAGDGSYARHVRVERRARRRAGPPHARAARAGDDSEVAPRARTAPPAAAASSGAPAAPAPRADHRRRRRRPRARGAPAGGHARPTTAPRPGAATPRRAPAPRPRHHHERRCRPPRRRPARTGMTTDPARPPTRHAHGHRPARRPRATGTVATRHQRPTDD